MSCDPKQHWLNETCLFCLTNTNGHEAGKAASSLAWLSADPAWSAEAWEWIVAKAEAGEMFTADDLVASVGVPENHPNAIGGIVRRASTKGIIQSVGVTQATRKESHGRLVRQWLGAAWVS
jgi:hypothetical protein